MTIGEARTPPYEEVVNRSIRSHDAPRVIQPYSNMDEYHETQLIPSGVQYQLFLLLPRIIRCSSFLICLAEMPQMQEKL